jgi:hypothetical protein
MKVKENEKRAISPVLITMLFLVIAIIGVVSYNIWIEKYSIEMQNNVENQQTTIPIIENVLGKTIYLKNTFTKEFVVEKILIDGVVCSNDDNLKPGMNDVEVSLCTSTLSTGEHEVVMVSKFGVYSKKIYFTSQGFDDLGNPLIIGDYNPYVEDETGFGRGCEELQSMQNNLDGDYYLVRDIYCENTSSWNGGAGFIPIGNWVDPFTGSLDGQEHMINELYINNDQKNTGLFGKLENAEISNLKIVVDLITGEKKNLGGVSGEIISSTITNVHVRGNITGDKKESGGIGGSIDDTTISRCSYGDGTVTGDRKSVGGLVGTSDNSLIENSFSTGDVVGNKEYVGGLVGSMSDTTIINCYSSGNVISSGVTGGLIGDSSNSVVNNSYWDTVNSGELSSSGGLGVNNILMTIDDTFVNWDFENVWVIDEGVDSPRLR